MIISPINRLKTQLNQELILYVSIGGSVTDCTIIHLHNLKLMTDKVKA